MYTDVYIRYRTGRNDFVLAMDLCSVWLHLAGVVLPSPELVKMRRLCCGRRSAAEGVNQVARVAGHMVVVVVVSHGAAVFEALGTVLNGGYRPAVGARVVAAVHPQRQAEVAASVTSQCIENVNVLPGPTDAPRRP